MATVGSRMQHGRKRRSTAMSSEAAAVEAPVEEEDDFEAQLEDICPSSDPGTADRVPAAIGKSSAEQHSPPGVQKIHVDSTHKLRTFVRLTAGGTRRKTKVKPVARPAASVFQAMEHQRNSRRCAPLWAVWLFAFNPTDRFKMSWDAGIFLLVVYSSFAVPYKTAFELETILREDPSSLGMTWREWVVDAFFYLDIILNFWTGYDNGYMIDTRKRKIAVHYLRSRFLVDVLAAVEWDLLIRLVVCGSGGCTGSLRPVNDYASLTRMLKVLRLARAGRLMSNLTSHTTVHSVYVDACTFFLYVLVIAHVLACSFYMVPILFSCDDEHEQVAGVWNMNYTCMPTSWRTIYELNDKNNQALMPKDSQYLSAMYWSLTTMTTIGYGDRGPGNDPEIMFTLCAEILGLCFFCLLLQEIAKVYEESRRQVSETNAVKNEIVQFVKRAVPSTNSVEAGIKEQLIDKIVGFLRFKATSSASRTFDVNMSPNFAELSEALQEEIKVAVFCPMLMEVRMFGRCTTDKEDEEKVDVIFREVDSDQSGKISESEVRELIQKNFDVELSDEELAAAISTMNGNRSTPGAPSGNKDSKGDDAAETTAGTTENNAEAAASEKDGEKEDHQMQIELAEFQSWWYLQKHGRPKIGPCPDEMLEWFALRLRSECASPCDRIVRKGDYGDKMYILNGGSIEICDHALPSRSEQHENQIDGAFDHVPSSFGRILRRIDMTSQDRVLGLLGVLNEPGTPAQREFRTIRRQMQQVAVYAGSGDHDYTEVLCLTNADVISGLKRNYHHGSWNVGEFGEPIRYWQECARNAYCELYWYDRDDAYEWNMYKQEEEEEEGDLLPDPGRNEQKRGRGKGSGARGRARGRGTGRGIATSKFNMKTAGALVAHVASVPVTVTSRGNGDSGYNDDLRFVESRQERIVEEQQLLDRKVSRLDQKVDHIVAQQQSMLDKLDAIANFFSEDFGLSSDDIDNGDSLAKSTVAKPTGKKKKKKTK